MLICFGSVKTSMKRLLVPLVLTLLAGLRPTQAAENLLKDGGFEQYLLQPEDYGNPFKVWSGWKWEGNCQRVADTDIKHEGQASAGMLGYGPCKLGISQTVRTEAGWYRLSGWVRAVELKPGLYERGLAVSFEADGKEIMTDLPTGTYGWRRFELTQRFDAPVDKHLLYIYLFGSGKGWLDDLRLEKPDAADLKTGLVLGPPEETFHPFAGNGEIPCPFCGLKADPAAAKCAVCGEPLSGVAEFAEANRTFGQVAALISEARNSSGRSTARWRVRSNPGRRRPNPISPG